MKRSILLSLPVTLLTPVGLLFVVVRGLLTPAYLDLAYSLPNFPPDEYGFTSTERRYYAGLALQYLLDEAPASFLGELKFSDGSPLYTERELAHMEDVQAIVQAALRIGYSTLALLFGLGLFAVLRPAWLPAYRRGLFWGGGLTIALVVLVGAGAAIRFWEFFTLFHSLFFEQDSWLFLYSDTLIRLFPMRFWQDAFLFAGLGMLGGGILLILTNHAFVRNRQSGQG